MHFSEDIFICGIKCSASLRGKELRIVWFSKMLSMLVGFFKLLFYLLAINYTIQLSVANLLKTIDASAPPPAPSSAVRSNISSILNNVNF